MTHDNVPLVQNGKSSPKLSTNGGYLNGTNGTNGSTKNSNGVKLNRNISWNSDIPPEKLSFTMRREFDKAKEESDLIDQLRRIIESRLKMVLPEDLAPSLTDGVVLCHLANHIKPRSVASIHVPSPAVPKLTMARCRRNVDNFLEACRRIGVEEGHLCCNFDITEGLHGRKGLLRLLTTVEALCHTQVTVDEMEDYEQAQQDSLVEQNNTVSTIALLSMFIGCLILLYLYPLPE